MSEWLYSPDLQTLFCVPAAGPKMGGVTRFVSRRRGIIVGIFFNDFIEPKVLLRTASNLMC